MGLPAGPQSGRHTGAGSGLEERSKLAMSTTHEQLEIQEEVMPLPDNSHDGVSVSKVVGVGAGARDALCLKVAGYHLFKY